MQISERAAFIHIHIPADLACLAVIGRIVWPPLPRVKTVQ